MVGDLNIDLMTSVIDTKTVYEGLDWHYDCIDKPTGVTDTNASGLDHIFVSTHLHMAAFSPNSKLCSKPVLLITLALDFISPHRTLLSLDLWHYSHITVPKIHTHCWLQSFCRIVLALGARIKYESRAINVDSLCWFSEQFILLCQ